MATTLSQPLVRETGLTQDGHEFHVILLPSDSGGSIVFKEKGKHGKGVELSLSKVLEIMQAGESRIGETKSDNKLEQKPEMKKKVVEEFDGDLSELDLIDMSTLESRIMMDGQMSPSDKGRIWSIIREIREERREEVGSPPLSVSWRKSGT